MDISSIIIVLLLSGAYWLYNAFRYYRDVMLIFESDKIELRDLILFSNYEIAQYLTNRFMENPEEVRVEYRDSKYVTFKKEDSEDKIISKLVKIQDSFIREKDIMDNISAVSLKGVDNLIIDGWLDYGCKKNYRSIMKKQMNEKLKRKEISNSSYNRFYRRFCKFKV